MVEAPDGNVPKRANTNAHAAIERGKVLFIWSYSEIQPDE
jgi:hypothetical protein